MLLRLARLLIGIWAFVSLFTKSSIAFSERSFVSVKPSLANKRTTACIPGRRFATRTLDKEVDAVDDFDECPSGYYLNSVHHQCSRLGPLGRASQAIETAGPFKRIYRAIGNLFGIDRTRISRLGVAFALSYSLISNINGSISLSIAWYMSCRKVSAFGYRI